MRYIIVAIVLVATALTGCTRTSQCVDYVGYENAAAMAEAADLVVVGDVTATDEVIDSYSARLRVHRVEVRKVLKGQLDESMIDVVAPPGGCFDTGTTIETDILDLDGAAELFLIKLEDRWVVLSPDQGAEPATDPDVLPWDPDSASE